MNVKKLVGLLIFKTDADKKLKKVDAQLKHVQKSSRKMSSQWRRMRSQMRRAGAEMRSMIGAYLGFRTLKYSIVGINDEISNLTTNAAKLGLSVRQLQEWRQALTEGLGEPVKVADKMFMQFQGKIGQAIITGTGTAVDALEKLGLSVEMLKQFKPNEQFELVAEALQKVKNDADKSAIAIALTGTRTGGTLVQISKNYKKLNQIRSNTRPLTLTREEIAAQARMQAKLAKLDLAWMKIKIAVLEVAEKALGPLVAKMSAWLKDPKNVKALKEWAARIFKIGAALAAVLVIMQGFHMVTSVIFGVADAFMKVLGVFKTISVFLSTNPWALLIGAIIALIVLVVVYRKEIWAFLKKVWGYVVKYVKKIWNFVKKYGEWIALALFGPAGFALVKLGKLVWKHKDEIWAVLKAVYKKVKSVVVSIVDAFKKTYQAVKDVWNGIGDFFSGLFDGIVKTFWRGLYGIVHVLAIAARKINSAMDSAIPDSLVKKLNQMEKSLGGKAGVGVRVGGGKVISSSIGKIVVNIQGSTAMGSKGVADAVGKGVRQAQPGFFRAEVANGWR